MAKYEVVQKHTLGHKVGDVIELTENQAKCLVNKVKLVVESERRIDSSDLNELLEVGTKKEVIEEKPAKKTKKADK